MKVTISDIARKCKVSIGTVSGVLHDKSNVKESTKQRVREVMRELHYIPYNNSQLVARQEMATVGLVVPEVYYQNHSLLTRAILTFKELLTESDTTCVIYNQKEIERRVTAGGAAGSGIIAGALVAFSCYSTLINRCLQQVADGGMPVVLVRRHENLAGVPEVLDDGYDGIMQLMEHLFNQGHRRFVYVPYHDNAYILDRETAFERFCADRGLAPETRMVLPFNRLQHDPDGWLAAARRSRPTAVVCADDAIAVQTLRVLQAVGISVPSDMAVTGFNNSAACELVQPRLTSVDIPVRDMLRMALRHIDDMRRGIRLQAAVTTLKDELIIRESSGDTVNR